MIWSNFYTERWQNTRNRLIGEPVRVELSSTEPVTLVEVKTHLRITDTDNDTELTDLITRCRREVEKRTNSSIVVQRITQTYDLYYAFDFYYGPILSIEEVSYKTGVSSLGVNEYEEVIEDGWRSDDYMNFRSSKYGVHKITYIAGYLVFPEDLKQIILQVIAIRYRHKGDALNESTIVEAINKIVEPYWMPYL